MASSSSPAVLSADHEFEARPSHRVAASSIQSDGDVWQEMLAVCEPPNNSKTDGSKKKKTGWGLMGRGNKQSGAGSASSSQTDGPSLVLRSYYECERTGKRVWDEPPSGASKVVQATDEMRQMAQLQLQELILSRSSAPESPVTPSDEDGTSSSTPTSGSSSSSAAKSAKKKGFFGKFRGGSNMQVTTVANSSMSATSTATNHGSASSSQDRSGKSNRGKKQQYRTNDVQLQQAIARSLADEGINQTSATETDDDRELQEQIDLAKALSLSVQS